MINSGIIFNIQRYSVNDGPGIRTVVFLKGCPLNCKWCSNPESQNYDIELMHIHSNCVSCDSCITTCPRGAIYKIEDNIYIERDKCDFCFSCVDICQHDAMRRVGYSLTTDEVIKEIEKDLMFYKRSGGGVTLSGGEPLYQFDFSINLLKELKARNIHTAIETSAYSSQNKINKIINFLDLILIDFKHPIDSEHKQYTGVSNKIIIQNIKYICNHDIDVRLRIPIIPNFNDDKISMKKSLDILDSIPNLNSIDIVPYHTFGVAKYQSLGRLYELKYLKPPSENFIYEIYEIFNNKNYYVRIER